MTAIQLKTGLHGLIDSIEDKTLLAKAYTLLSSLAKKNDLDNYDSLPLELQQAIEEGISQLDKGEGISYQEFRREVKQKHQL